MKREALNKLRKLLGPEFLLTSVEERACYSVDGTRQPAMPEAVAFPESAQQIASIMALANQYTFPVVPRGAGTGMTGGAVPVAGGLVLVMTRMNRILEIDQENMIAVVEPGVITGDLQNELRKVHLMYPPDPASLKVCSLGGNAAECAGGPSAVKYGVTRDYVIGLEVVLPSGEIMKTGVRTEKGVVGYDLTHLLLGSEGTLAIFTKLVLRLLPLPETKETFLLTFPSIEDATRSVAEILRSGLTPCTLEYMDATAISVVREFLTNPLPADTAALLLLEFDGTISGVAEDTALLTTFLMHRQIRFELARNQKEIEELWLARRSISPATFKLRPHKISEDVVVPRSKIPDLVAFTTRIAKELGLIILTFGHAGDGNIHVNIMVDKADKEEYRRGQSAKKQLFSFVVSIKGTLSGEHGIGTTKSAYLALEISPPAIAIMRKLKHLFDPHNILNPGKIFPVPDNCK